MEKRIWEISVVLYCLNWYCRVKSIRVLITDRCNADCPNCINKKIRSGVKFMDIKRFKMLVHYFHDNEVVGIRLMGGEPTIHPYFGEMVTLAQSLFLRVTVFTNGLSRNLLDFSPRECDGVNYNLRFAQLFADDILMKDKSGTRTFSVVIYAGMNVEDILQKIGYINSIMDGFKVSLTFDCTANIFKYRRLLLDKFDRIYGYCQSKDIETVIDHSLPICFLYKSNVPTYKSFSLCTNDCSGLIDADCNLHFCNQVSDIPFPLFSGEKLKPYKLIENQLFLAYCEKQIVALKKICGECPFYNGLCNGGCYIQNQNITRDDIIKNTELPIMSI